MNMPAILTQFSAIRRFLFFFAKKLRLGNPWKFKAPFLLCVPYLVIWHNDNLLPQAFQYMLLCFSIITGVAGVGYLSNDLGDRHSDSRIGKENATQMLAPLGILLLFLFFLSLAILPWYFFPVNLLSVVLLASELLLFFAYALPPLRLKEKPLAGPVADALYAHALPALLAGHTFILMSIKYQATTRPYDYYIPFLSGLVAWQLILGLRNILLHQLQDAEQDRNSGTVTFVTRFGEGLSEKLVKALILMELMLFIVFSLMIPGVWDAPVFALAGLVYWIIISLRFANEIKQWNYRKRAYVFLDDWYILWFPLFTVLFLTIKQYHYWPLLALHLIVVRNGISQWIKSRQWT